MVCIADIVRYGYTYVVPADVFPGVCGVYGFACVLAYVDTLCKEP